MDLQGFIYQIAGPAVLYFVLWGCARTTEDLSVSGTAEPATVSDSVVADKDQRLYGDLLASAAHTDSLKILPPGLFHYNEVSPTANGESWFGLFKGNDGYYLSRTPISLQRVYDPILDADENSPTGWEVKALNGDTCLIFIQEADFLRQRKVHFIEVSPKYVYPGDTLKLDFFGKVYLIYGTGEMKETQISDYYITWNYKFHLSQICDGDTTDQVLIDYPFQNDEGKEIIFAGDIDGDKRLDLLIDTTYHYNVEVPTLFLSAPADSAKLVKAIGSHCSVGC